MVLFLAIFGIGIIHHQIYICLASTDEQFIAQLAFLTEKYGHIENELKLVKEENSVLRKQLEIISKDNAQIKSELQNIRVEVESSHTIQKDNPNNVIDVEDNLNDIFKSANKLKERTLDNTEFNHTQSYRGPFDIIHKQNNEKRKEKKRLLLDTITPSPATISKVAFSAVLTQKLLLGEHQIVEYDKIITNVGNGYDSRHGHFTAPVKGVYLMACSIMNIIGANADIEIVKNGARIAHIYGESDDYSMGTQVTIVVLEKGDMVWIRHEGGSPIQTLNGGEYNTFSGTILFEI